MNMGRMVGFGVASLTACACAAASAGPSALGAVRAGGAARFRDGTVSVISTRSNRVVATVRVGPIPVGVAVVPGRAVAYVFGYGSRDSVYRVAVHGGGGQVQQSERLPGG